MPQWRISLSQLVFFAALFVGRIASAQPAALPQTSGPILPLYRALRDIGLDSQRVYKIREATLDRDDLHIYFDDGVIAFTQTVGGRITGAYFEGEGEVLVRPPDRRERAALGLFIGQGVLEEHFASVYLRFNDDTAAELQQYLRPADNGAAFVAQHDALARQLAANDAMRLTISFTCAPSTPPGGQSAASSDRVLHARVASARLGNFDVYFDTIAPEQIIVGQVKYVADQPYYDLWMSFPTRAVRQQQAAESRFHGPTGPAWTRDSFQVESYNIQAAIEPSLVLSADAVLEGNVRGDGYRILLVELSRYLQLKSVAMDGQQLEFIQNESIEGGQLSRRGNDQVAVVFPRPLSSGQKLRLKFSYAGSVLSDAGGGLFAVGARGTWYPNRGIAMAHYDITFRFPRAYTLVATGKQVDLQPDGSNTVGHWVSEGAVPVAGFNLGRYLKTTATAGDVVVNSYATGAVENKIPQSNALSNAVSAPVAVGPEGANATSSITSPAPPVSGAAPIAQRAADTILALQKMLGPYPFSSLALTQRPGSDSQGWPGIVFLSSYVYLTPEQRTAAHVSAADSVLYGHVMLPHEIAHQWFGDRVSWASYHEQWLMEAIANYAALMLMEKGQSADFQLMLQTYRQLLATPNKDGLKNVEAGPVTLGVRLSSYKFPAGYEIITYGRGTWLIHMLREMLRDASRSSENPAGSDAVFLAFLRSVYDRYQGREITNADFESELEAVLPKSLWFENRRSLDWFFDGWVNGTAFPRYEVKDAKFSASAGKSTVSATLRQLDASDDLVTSIPIYGLVGEKKLYLGRVFAEGAETRFMLPAPTGVHKLVPDPYQTVLTAP